jgi:DNA repair exonuclease SbcCD nuclease subunit
MMSLNYLINKMIKKLVHFSDLHIRLFKDHDLYRGILNDMLEQFKEIAPDRIVFTGDLVHSKNQMTPELIEFVAWILTECSQIAKTIVIIGNHDFLESNSSRLDALTPVIDSLKNDNIVYLKNRGEYEDDNVDWVVYSLLDHNIPPEIEKTGRLKIGLFHGPVQGLTTDIGYKFETGFETDKFNGCDLVLCGDIHKRQIFNIPGGKKAYMVGSTIQQNYGETITKHGFGIYNLESDDYSFVDLDNPKPFLSFKMKSFDDIINGTEKLVNSGTQTNN